jgi:hypothetical protein
VFEGVNELPVWEAGEVCRCGDRQVLGGGKESRGGGRSKVRYQYIDWMIRGRQFTLNVLFLAIDCMDDGWMHPSGDII